MPEDEWVKPLVPGSIRTDLFCFSRADGECPALGNGGARSFGWTPARLVRVAALSTQSLTSASFPGSKKIVPYYGVIDHSCPAPVWLIHFVIVAYLKRQGFLSTSPI